MKFLAAPAAQMTLHRPRRFTVCEALAWVFVIAALLFVH